MANNNNNNNNSSFNTVTPTIIAVGSGRSSSPPIHDRSIESDSVRVDKSETPCYNANSLTRKKAAKENLNNSGIARPKIPVLVSQSQIRSPGTSIVVSPPTHSKIPSVVGTKSKIPSVGTQSSVKIPVMVSQSTSVKPPSTNNSQIIKCATPTAVISKIPTALKSPESSSNSASRVLPGNSLEDGNGGALVGKTPSATGTSESSEPWVVTVSGDRVFLRLIMGITGLFSSLGQLVFVILM